MEVKFSSDQKMNPNSSNETDISKEVFKVPGALQVVTSRGLTNASSGNSELPKCLESCKNVSNDQLSFDQSNSSNNGNNKNLAKDNEKVGNFIEIKELETKDYEESVEPSQNKISPSKDQKSASIPYKEPPWGGLNPPPENDKSLYTLEELKSGVIVKTHELSKSYQVVGRLPTCDIQLEHPSLSRYHAILQFKAVGSSDKPAGFYLYDLNSTHGTFHNKNKCFPKTYYRLRVGHMIKFGGSTRQLILQGPDEDTEKESELSVTELKEIATQKARKKQEEKRVQEKQDAELESQGISWGMAEDAIDEEDSENRSDEVKIATPLVENDSLYLNDPKKTLRGWFEREGYDLEYDCQELSYAKFKCTVTLPVEDENGVTTDIIAEATVSGKKKEAVVSCALEACRILDRRGLLRASKHESRQKKNVKKWEENDFYDSDEDEFLDRTGSLQAKRQKRMQSVKGSKVQEDEKAVPETFETLTEKHQNLSKEILELQERITKAKTSMEYLNSQQQEVDNEDLDTYMAAIESSADCSKTELGKLTTQLFDLKSKSKKLEKLIEIARPAKMPGFLSGTKTDNKKTLDENGAKKTSKIMVGKMFGRGLGKLKPLNPNIKNIVAPSMNLPKNTDILPASDMPRNLITNDNQKNEKKRVVNSSVNHQGENYSPQPTTKISETSNSESIKNHKATCDVVKEQQHKKVSNTSAIKCKNSVKDSIDLQSTIPSKMKPYEVMSEQDERYTSWIPPKNQSGDGRTSLNDKYGY